MDYAFVHNEFTEQAEEVVDNNLVLTPTIPYKHYVELVRIAFVYKYRTEFFPSLYPGTVNIMQDGTAHRRNPLSSEVIRQIELGVPNLGDESISTDLVDSSIASRLDLTLRRIGINFSTNNYGFIFEDGKLWIKDGLFYKVMVSNEMAVKIVMQTHTCMSHNIAKTREALIDRIFGMNPVFIDQVLSLFCKTCRYAIQPTPQRPPRAIRILDGPSVLFSFRSFELARLGKPWNIIVFQHTLTKFVALGNGGYGPLSVDMMDAFIYNRILAYIGRPRNLTFHKNIKHCRKIFEQIGDCDLNEGFSLAEANLASTVKKTIMGAAFTQSNNDLNRDTILALSANVVNQILEVDEFIIMQYSQ